MKILAIDDQKLVLLPIEKRLNELEYKVKTETNSIKAIGIYHSFKPDLVIVDINMPKISGLEIVKYIRNSENPKTPILILSGDTNDNVIIEGFDLGINDYMKKPISLNEICVRIKKLIGIPKQVNTVKTISQVIIQQRCVGVVIPCYNEEQRLLSKKFTNYIDKNSGYHLCFVNDGSKDKTLEVLKKLQKGREEFITIYDCKKNGGKAEAVVLSIYFITDSLGLIIIGAAMNLYKRC